MSAVVTRSDDKAPDRVTGRLRDRSRVLGHLDIAQKNRDRTSPLESELPQVALVELHCTDACDLDCVFCTYADRKAESFPWEGLARVAELAPRAIVLAGGGEPTLYRNGPHRISELILELHRLLPQTRIGLISNGALVPNAEALQVLSWARVSLDASSERNHDAIKRTRHVSFEQRLENIDTYRRSTIPDVGIGFVYNRMNLHEAADFLMLFYARSNAGRREGTGELSIQFRPTCGIESCACPSPNYSLDKGRLMTPDRSPWWIDARERQLARVRALMADDPSFEHFVHTATNFFSGEFGGPIERLSEFGNCYLALVRMVIRADGDIFPCVMTASQRKRRIGNILRSSGEELHGGMRNYFALADGYCAGRRDCCNIDGVKNIYMEEALRGERQLSSRASSDPFF